VFEIVPLGRAFCMPSPPPAVRPGTRLPALFRHHTKGPTQHTLSSVYRSGNVCAGEACRGHATLSYFWPCE
jgi:hypothetical protein